jgi:hypothetical protein
MTLLARTGIVNTYATAFSATGGTTTDSGGYRYHTFNSSGSFVVSSGSKTVEVLTVGGGGAGGTALYGGKQSTSGGAGGGGAGLYESKSINASTGTYTVLIGAGAVSGGSNGYPYNGTPSYITTSSSSTVYAVGNTGPAGGKVFMTPSYSDGNGLINTTGLYFELAPVAAEVSRTWAESTYQSTALAISYYQIGFGYSATNNIVAQGNSSAATCAAKYCADYTYGGFSDWFLPSTYEMTAIYNAGGTFGTNASISTSTAYWSSTGSGAGAAETRLFSSSFPSSAAKSTSLLVRPVRAFSTTGETLVYGAGGGGGAHGDNLPAVGGMSMFYGGNQITNTTNYKTGGGGGAGGAGVDGTWDSFYYPVAAGNGGAGTTWNGFKSFGGGGGGGSTSTGSSTQSTVGSGGSTGGGAGGTITSGVGTSGTAGTANTGGGGGGAAYDWAQNTRSGATGGSGVVIVRYLL